MLAQYLREQQHDVWEHWHAAIAAHPGDPCRQLEAHLVTVKDKAYRGCALGNAAHEIADEDDVLSQLVRPLQEWSSQPAAQTDARDARATPMRLVTPTSTRFQ